MAANILLWLYMRFVKGGDIVLAMLFVTRIIAGKSTYAEVPALLKEQVAELLRDAGLGHLAGDTQGA